MWLRHFCKIWWQFFDWRRWGSFLKRAMPSKYFNKKLISSFFFYWRFKIAMTRPWSSGSLQLTNSFLIFSRTNYSKKIVAELILVVLSTLIPRFDKISFIKWLETKLCMADILLPPPGYYYFYCNYDLLANTLFKTVFAFY